MSFSGAWLDHFEIAQLSVWIDIWPDHEQDWNELRRLSVKSHEFKWRRLCETASQKVTDETLDLVIELLWMEASHDA